MALRRLQGGAYAKICMISINLKRLEHFQM